ncbi:hypothetical protein E6W36_10320 [Hankyongella ginsenosidimutans]|uniref:Peptidase S8/S53 domain-containing protein n=1 Tax=Hankyongella ginsenosidimutans TaxID=1763828 RepID=A0A4D7C737_9SPHN|nr:hypothetical protein [Hankyongella ginsenosidimutans]QCI79790.1 hypothetical protein E6W36_10320 [Hankyongella ginsenosidimutans]
MVKGFRLSLLLALAATLVVGMPAPVESQARPARLREHLPERAQTARLQRLRSTQTRTYWRERMQQRAIRRERQRERLRRFRAFLEQLRNGDLVVQGEVLATDASDAAIARARDLGFSVLRDRVIDGLGQRLTVLRAAQGVGIEQALADLRAADPGGDYDYNHVLEGAGASGPRVADAGSGGGGGVPASHVRIGLIDSGVDAEAPTLRSAHILVKGFTESGAIVGDAHGTAIASMLVGKTRN